MLLRLIVILMLLLYKKMIILIKKWFHLASTSQGGFVSAHVYLARSSTFLTKLPLLLMDYDPSKSLVARLGAVCIDECRCKSASTKEKTVIKLQNFIDNSMSKLTANQQKIEIFSLEESTKKNEDEHLTVEDDESRCNRCII